MASDIVDFKSSEFIPELKKHVLNGNTDYVCRIIDDVNFKESLKTDSFDLIRIICQLLNESKAERKPKFVECCECVLLAVAEYGNYKYPEEIVLELTEQAESAEDDTFLMLVIPMQQVLLRIPGKQQPLEWVLNTLHKFIYSLPFPEDYKLEEDEQLLLENDSSFITIQNLYEVILDFYEPFMAKVVASKSSKEIELEHNLLQSFIHLLGKPVTFLDLTIHKSKSAFRCYVEKIISWIESLDGGMLIYSSMDVEKRDLNDLRVERDKDDRFVNCDISFHDFLLSETVPIDALAVFYYMVFFENNESLKLPCVYNAEFVFEKCLYFAIVLIEMSHSSAQFKGVFLAEALVNRINDNSITFEALEAPIHKVFFEILSKHAVYNEVEKIRKMCVTIISVCFKKYDCKSKYLILYNLERSINHSGLRGYFITFVKDIVVMTLDSRLDLYMRYFSGKNLFDLMKKYCKLPNGVESDLVDTADTIISSLNLIRFLVLRDTENISGIWNYINEIKAFLLKPLQEGLTLSRSHFTLKLNELKEKNTSTDDINKKMSVTVGKEQLGPMSKEHEISVINSALNAFDLIESILSRVNECISLRNS